MAEPMGSSLLHMSDEVALALRSGRAVVALESTIVSHGMPYPQNLETALEVEAVVRQHGAVPATIAIIGGVPCIGLSHAQLKHIAQRGTAVTKVSRRDLALVIAKRLDGATTVSATMLLAARAGIKVFVTGGIGGVHQGGELSMDVSADLTELARTPVGVICAGVKSILDIPRTLEFLETQGAAVASFRQDHFPAFFSASSGVKAPCRVESPAEFAAMIHATHKLALGSGLVLGVPIPEEAVADGAIVEAAISQALREADAQGIKGNAITPFLLDRIRVLTGGKSLEANIKLIKNNARVGAAVAAALANLGPEGAALSKL